MFKKRVFGKPIKPSDEEVRAIMNRLEAAKHMPAVEWQPGEKLHVVDGPFKGFNGTAQHVDFDRQIIRGSINIFGRDTPVELEFTQVEKL